MWLFCATLNLYGVNWNVEDPAKIEAKLYAAGGYLTLADGRKIGMGKLHHFKQLIHELCPWFAFHSYTDLILDAWVNHDTIGISGPGSTGKTFTCAMAAYAEFFVHPRGTTIIMSSLTLEGLRLRIWGAIGEILKRVHEKRPDAPGYLVPSERRIYPSEPTEEEKNDPRDAIIGVACKQGDTFVGIGCFPAGTPVDTPLGPIPIEQIKIGQYVINAVGCGCVYQTHHRKTSEITRVFTNDRQEIVCTPNHEFFTQRGWIPADKLRKGDLLVGVDVCQKVDCIASECFKTKLDVYNLAVDGHPSYSVYGVLVHNSYVGIKNERIFGIFDEISLAPMGFWDSIANLSKNPKTKFVGLGNPKDYYDALGKICEPATEIGGWDALPFSEHTRTWKARGQNSIAVQLSGLDTPNGTDVNCKKWPYPYLITPKQIADDAERFGRDSWQFQMMDLGVWPRGEASRRVITRAICEAGNAFGEPLWDGVTPTTDYVGIDAAYSGVGGDRTPLIHLRSGKDINGKWILAFVDTPLIIPVDLNRKDEDGKMIPSEIQIATYTRDYCQKRNISPNRVGFDSTGRGSLMRAFAMLWSAQVVAVEFGGLPSEDRRVLAENEKVERQEYGKMVTALWFGWRNLVICGQMRKLPMSVFEEGTLREFRIVGAGKTDVEPKEDMMKRMGRSPDLGDATAVAIEVARRNGFQIGDAAKTRSTPSKWLANKSSTWRDIVSRDVLEQTA